VHSNIRRIADVEQVAVMRRALTEVPASPPKHSSKYEDVTSKLAATGVSCAKHLCVCVGVWRHGLSPWKTYTSFAWCPCRHCRTRHPQRAGQRLMMMMMPQTIPARALGRLEDGRRLKQVCRISGDCLMGLTSRSSRGRGASGVCLPSNRKAIIAAMGVCNVLAVLPARFERAEIAPRKPAVPTRDTALPKVGGGGRADSLVRHNLVACHSRGTEQF
jgi:hypothetical protein